jgi:hypothetical protein
LATRRDVSQRKRENDEKSGVSLGSRKLRNIPDDNTAITAIRSDEELGVGVAIGMEDGVRVVYL